MSTTPTSLSLTSIADNSQIIASTHRNNNNAIQTAVNALISFLSGGTSSQVVTSGGGTTINYAYPPGYEYAYNEFTSTVNITATTEATANTVATASAVTFDGATVVEISFQATRLAIGTAGQWVLWLYDGATSIGEIASSAYDSAGVVTRRLTPSAAAHTYSIRGSVNAGTANAQVGAGGNGLLMPGFIKIKKV